MADSLMQRQEAGLQTEKRLLVWLVEFEPAGRLTIDDAKAIASAARHIAFDEFSMSQP